MSWIGTVSVTNIDKGNVIFTHLKLLQLNRHFNLDFFGIWLRSCAPLTNLQRDVPMMHTRTRWFRVLIDAERGILPNPEWLKRLAWTIVEILLGMQCLFGKIVTLTSHLEIFLLTWNNATSVGHHRYLTLETKWIPAVISFIFLLHLRWRELVIAGHAKQILIFRRTRTASVLAVV